MAYCECDYMTIELLFAFIGIICGAFFTLMCTFFWDKYDMSGRVSQAQLEENRHTIMTAISHNS